MSNLDKKIRRIELNHKTQPAALNIYILQLLLLLLMLLKRSKAVRGSGFIGLCWNLLLLFLLLLKIGCGLLLLLLLRTCSLIMKNYLSSFAKIMCVYMIRWWIYSVWNKILISLCFCILELEHIWIILGEKYVFYGNLDLKWTKCSRRKNNIDDPSRKREVELNI